MDVAILTREPGLYSNQRFLQSAQARHLRLQFIDPVNADQAAAGDSRHVKAVIPRFMPRWQEPGDRLLRAFQAAGAHALNTADAIALARSAPDAWQRFQLARLPLPETRHFRHSDSPLRYEQLPFGFPMVIKRHGSAQGLGVQLLENAASAEQAVLALRGMQCGFALQQFIAESAGCDLRLMVMAGRVVAAMKRQALPGEFRANSHLGGTAACYQPCPMEVEIAVTAASCLGLTVAGVDILLSRKGPLLLEVNACPGFEVLERVTGVDVAGEMLNLLINRQF